ncbi:hypothetical protein DEDE109153_01080 [Deinococcus deserti]|uniref:Uncharacterized protein n=1 Tax=Deinococcus deserti (strain DSM 17065 / CIP 109153 / LMG 22923 / VCD115) TaxID=546414 RepID=X5H5P8_DEIDV|nr:hypothetical protein [Deinococcus deserti]AHX26513.1 hypothetical protein Deide_13073 [Deinococcus deserti VCD115]
MKAGTRGRLARLAAKQPGEAVRVVITRQIVDHGPDGVPVPVRTERREVLLYPAGGQP